MVSRTSSGTGASQSSAGASGSSAAASGSSRGSIASDGKAARVRNYSAVWVGGQCYGLDIRVVGELVTVETLLPVPLAPPSVLGLFSLRGTPVALVDLVSLLELSSEEGHGRAEISGDARSALVLRTGDLQVAVLIDRMETVISSDRGHIRMAEGGAADSLIEGFFETEERGGLVLRVLNGAELLERLRGLKYRQRGAEEVQPTAELTSSGSSSAASEASKGE